MTAARVLIITDNPFALETCHLLQERHSDIHVYQSPSGNLPDIPRIRVRDSEDEIVERYTVVLSMHCRQFFQESLVRRIRCINVHPGYNPYNRGWYPHVFSMINGMRAGVTIHEIDKDLDHGPIIVQREVEIQNSDTSETVYKRIMSIERDLLLMHFDSLVSGDYEVKIPEEGNINYRKDFDRLMKIDLDRVGTFREFLDHLRALTHPPFDNAYFNDDSGEKVYVSLNIHKSNTANS